MTWSSIDQPDAWDWIAVYCGHESVPSSSNYLDWIYVPYAAASGSVTFKNMVNMRCTYFFRYYRDLPDGKYQNLAESNEVSPAGGFNIPMHGRLSLTGKPTEMQVTWTSGSQEQPMQYVRYDNNCSDIYGIYVDGKSHTWAYMTSNSTVPTTYTASDMCGYPSNEVSQRYYRNPGYFHSVLLEDLIPNSMYCYQYGNNVDGYSDVHFFRAPPTSDSDGVSFIAYGDMVRAF